MGLLYWKQILGFLVFISTFLSGWYVRDLQEDSHNAKKLTSEMSIFQSKISDNQKIDTDYNNHLQDIVSKVNNQKIEDISEKINSCVIPTQWVRYLNTDN